MQRQPPMRTALRLTLIGLALWVGHDGVAQTADSVDTAARAVNIVHGKTVPAPTSKVPNSVTTTSATRDAVTPQPLRVASSTSQASFRERVSIGEDSWLVSKTTNPAGAFILLRNTSDAANADGSIRVVFGDDRRMLDARKTATWTCGPAKGGDGTGTSLHVETKDGETIHRAVVHCGDAVYVGRQGVSLDAESIVP